MQKQLFEGVGKAALSFQNNSKKPLAFHNIESEEAFVSGEMIVFISQGIFNICPIDYHRSPYTLLTF